MERSAIVRVKSSALGDLTGGELSERQERALSLKEIVDLVWWRDNTRREGNALLAASMACTETSVSTGTKDLN